MASQQVAERGACEGDTSPESLSNRDCDFLSTCTEVFDLVTKIKNEYGEPIISSSMGRTLECTRSMLETKHMCISVLGQHNSGKSTFINALLGDEFLPVNVTIETSVRVEVQHSDTIHQGVCSERCSQQQSEAKKCPRLEIAKNVAATGANDIYSTLEEINQHPEVYSKKKVVLKVNIPLLSENVPQGWQLSIIDNPGFGDAREHVTQIANESVLSSSVYVYIFDLFNIGGRIAEDFFRDLNGKDKGAIQEGRLIVVIAKFDESFKSRHRSRRQAPVTEESLRSKVLKSVENAIQGVKISDDNIIPVCRRWALAASILSNAVDGDTIQEDVDEKLDVAQKALEECPDIDLPGGQDQSQRDLIRLLDSRDVIQRLETASGFHNLKLRLKSVGRTCSVQWKAKVSNQCRALLHEAVTNINQKSKQTQDICCQKENEFQESTSSLKQINDNKKVLAATTSSNSEEAKPILKTFEETYAQDIEKPVSLRLGRERTHKLVSDFKEECKEKIDTKQFGQAEFESCLQRFLEKCEAELGQEFYTCCSFPKAFRYQSYLNERITQNIELLGAAAREVICVRALNPNKSVKKELLSSLCYNPEHDLKPTAITLSSSGPSLSCVKEEVLSYFQLLCTDELEVDEHRDIPSLRQISQISPIRTFSLGERLHQFIIRVPLFARFLRRKTSERNSRAEHTSRQQATVPSIEYSSKDHHEESNLKFDEWTNELEDAVDTMTGLITEACDEYFDNIKDDVVQHFYKEYRTKATQSLEKFDEEYNNQLTGKIEKLNQDISDLKTEIQNLGKCKDTMVHLCQKVCPEDYM